MSSKKKDAYRLRFDALIEIADKMESDQPALASLISEFKAFSEGYFNYLAKIGKGTERSQRLNMALARLQEEWANISHAYGQRQTSTLREHLKEADGVAEEYNQRFSYGRHKQKPVVFFDKRFAITRFPFTPNALISMPLQLHNANQWQPLAHELGHHIYWNSLELGKYEEVHKNLRKTLLHILAPSAEDYEQFKDDAQLVEIWSVWLEEAFADICGVLLAGVSYAQSSQALAQNFLPDLFSAGQEEEGEFDEHPTPLVRPLIALETLKQIANASGNTKDGKQYLQKEIDSLSANWNTVYERFDNHFTINGVGIHKIGASVETVVSAILKSKWGNGQLLKRFKYEEWLGKLPDVEYEVALVSLDGPKRTRSKAKLKPLSPPDNDSFKAVFDHIKAKIEARMEKESPAEKLDQEILAALLELELGIDEALWSRCEYRKIGNTYIRCSCN